MMPEVLGGEGDLLRRPSEIRRFERNLMNAEDEKDKNWYWG